MCAPIGQDDRGLIGFIVRMRPGSKAKGYGS